MSQRSLRQAPGGILLLALLALLSGCSGDATGPQADSGIAVFGYLYVGEQVTEENAILVSEVRSVGDFYDPSEAAVTNAMVTLRRRGDATSDTLAMVRPGHYAGGDLVIEPATTYDLQVAVPGRPLVTGTTTTPAALETHGGPRVRPGTMRISSIPDSFTIAVSCPNGEQMILLDVYCLENWEDARFVNSVGSHDHPTDYGEYGRDNGEPRHIFAYFKVKNLADEGSDHLINFYDGMMVFYGRYTVTCLTMDDNYYSYLYRDHPQENGGITGGIGVFASACRTRYEIEVTP
jgi:hypothetical protein